MRVLLCCALVLLLSSCKQNAPTTKNLQNSPETLEYVEGYTTGGISTHGVVKVFFAQEVSVMPENDNFVEFSPQFEVGVSWISNREVHFTPKAFWRSDISIMVSVDLSMLFESIQSSMDYSFTFRCAPPYAEVKGMRLTPTGGNQLMKFEGEVLFHGYEKDEIPTPSFVAQLDGEKVKVNYELEGELGKFIVPNMLKTDQDQNFQITISGKSIGKVSDVQFNTKVPRKGKLTITSVTTSEDEGQVIRAFFSYPLDPNQDLTGLVEVSDQETARTLIVGNELRIFTRGSARVRKLKLYPGIQDRGGRKSTALHTEEVRWGVQPPEIQFLEDGKNILPDPKRSKISFKATNLKSVVVRVEKIHEHNVLQHLQVNTLEGDYQIHRVSEPIFMDRIDLKSYAEYGVEGTNKFALDLTEFFEQEQGAIYRVLLAFDKEDVAIACADQDYISSPYDEMNEQQALDKWYDDGFDWSSYNWRERENPCHQSFYRRDKWKSITLMASPFALISKYNRKDQLSVFVMDLASGQPVSNCLVEVLNYQQRTLSERRTNSEGRVDFTLGKGDPYFIIARGRKYVSYMAMEKGKSLSMSPFDVGGYKVPEGGSGYIFAERGVWRPGDTIFAHFILDQERTVGLTGPPVVAKLHNPQGVMVKKKIAVNSIGGIYALPFTTIKESPTGLWRLDVYAEGSVYTKYLNLETIKPNRLKIDLDFDKTVLSYKDIKPHGEIGVSWLTGALAGNIVVEGEKSMRESKLTALDWPEYVFGSERKKWTLSRTPALKMKTNAIGKGSAQFDFSEAKQSNGPVEVKISGRAYEPGGEYSIFQKSIVLHPYSHYVGLNMKGKANGLLSSDAHAFPIISVDPEGNNIQGRPLQLKIFRKEWRWWWDRNERTSFTTDQNAQLVIEESLTSGARPVSWSLSGKQLNRGRYAIQIEDVESGHKVERTFYVHDYEYWWLDEGAPEGASVLQFELSDKKVNVGEDIEVKVPTKAGSKLLMSIENADEVLQSAWADTRDGHTVLNLKATQAMTPNVYVHLTLINPLNSLEGTRPIRSYAVKPIEIVDPDMVLMPVLDAPDEIQPEKSFDIKVSEVNGKKMAYTIAIVDEGLLSLTNFKSPDPAETFLSKQALGIHTWDSYDQIQGPNAGGGRPLAIGGDMELKSSEDQSARRFVPVVRQIGPFLLEPNENKIHKVKLPSYLGNVRIMLVAAYAGAYGHAERNMLIREDLMVLASAPRSLAPGDEFSLPITVFVMDKSIPSADVEVTVEGPLSVMGPSAQRVTFNGSPEKVVNARIKVGSAEGVGRIRVKTKGNGNESLYELEIPVKVKSLPRTEVKNTVLNPGALLEVNYEPLGISGTNTFTLEASRIPPINLEARVQYLMDYPYGCGEQRASKIFAQLNLESLTDLNTDQKTKLRQNIESGLADFVRFQKSGGGISYWEGQSEVDVWLSTYVAYLSVCASQAGYIVPETFQKGVLTFVKERAESWRTAVTGDNEIDQAFRLFVLAQGGDFALGAMNRMKSYEFSSSIGTRLLAGAYALSGYEETAQQLLATTPSGESKARISRYYSRIMEKALLGITQLALGDVQGAFETNIALATSLGEENRYFNTHGLAWSLQSLSAFARKQEVGEHLDINITNKDQNVDLQGSASVHQWHLKNVNQAGRYTVVNNGSENVYVSQIRRGTPIRSARLEPISKKSTVNVSYTDLTGQKVDISRLDQGQTFVAKIEVGLKDEVSQNTYENLALSFIIPSGWEIVNTRLDQSGFKQSSATHIDMRDDRVYYHMKMRRNDKKTFYCLLNATYAGRFFMPACQFEAMYTDEIFASTVSNDIEIVP